MRRFVGSLARLVLLAGVAAIALPGSRGQPAAEVSSEIRGLPMTRVYPFEEIGNVSRGARLNFDAYGRVAVIQDGAYIVLNDSNWIDLAAGTAPGSIVMQNVIKGADGRWYFGAQSNWGVAEYTPDGRLRPRSLVTPSAPAWVSTTNFSDLVSTSTGLYAGGLNGAVYVDFSTRAQVYIPVPELSRIFKIGDRVYASAHNHRIQSLDIGTQSARPVPGTELGGYAVDQVTALDQDRVLISTFDGKLYIFDGVTAIPWDVPIGNGPNNRISALIRLIDGDVAIAVNGRGLYFVSVSGEVRFVLSSPEYHRITDLANREPGVLWIASESGIEKILYGSPVTMFGQRLGLPVSWPQVAQFDGKVIIASAGRLYQASPGGAGAVSGFRIMADQPTSGVWAIAAKGGHLLVGNSKGVYELTTDEKFVPVTAPMDVARLVMVNSELCFAIGLREIAALRYVNGRWAECAPRVAGVGYPAIVHAAPNSAWIEIGPNHAARVSLHDGVISTRVLDAFPWKEVGWVNIGVVGDTIVLSGPNSGRVFFSEKTEAFCEAPELQALLDDAPYWVTRVQADEHGTLWATHSRGIFTIHPNDPLHRFDTTTFDIINDRTPLIQLLPGGDVWITSGHSLYHANPRTRGGTIHPFRPTLISVVDGQTNAELIGKFGHESGSAQLPFARNTLNFRFFAGSYGSRRTPSYEYRLNRHGNDWTTLANGSVINFHQLREGDYRLDVRLTDSHGPVGTPTSVTFTILPPWYRTWYAYVLCTTGTVLVIWTLVRWSSHRARARNIVLENLVQKRTEELQLTMQRLAEETRNAATLAERARIAGEIHDSLQQGLSGLILQLDATLKLPGLGQDVRSRLSVARNMVSFTRHEVQHAVWDMESSLLEGTGLDDALRKITSLINSGTVRIEISVSGAEVPLSSEIKHHLLRMGQEAITNAVRHSDATLITIQLEYEAQTVTLSVTDNGRGFDPEQIMTNGFGHFGLRGLRTRASKIGGHLEVQSAPGQGTTVRIAVPLASTATVPVHANAGAN